VFATVILGSRLEPCVNEPDREVLAAASEVPAPNSSRSRWQRSFADSASGLAAAVPRLHFVTEIVAKIGQTVP